MPSADPISEIRRFARFFTQKVGALETSFLGESLSLPEARVIFEIGSRKTLTASDLVRDLSLDAGYVSRLCKTLEKQGIIERRPSPQDARKQDLVLSGNGIEQFHRLEEKSSNRIATMLDTVEPAIRESFSRNLRQARECFEGKRDRNWLLRQHQPGDCGWIMQKFSQSMIGEFGLSPDFEAVVGDILVGFIKRADHDRERCWIAERDGAPVGSVMLVADTATTAKLRLLVVTPEARGLGIGQRLVAECILFARQKQYERISLWTYDCLTSARDLYRQAGFKCQSAELVMDFGKAMTSEIWELEL
jgi:DNA-binding MarR family transcriptional regulator/N-acetylglutamate synthase-like GNAT family acetyltransferase